ncbi:MAG TPA: glutaredoxin 3 [Methylococcaceae bacterium]|nr:glutaredoxin 3 [Methylococcaceae bacterium]
MPAILIYTAHRCGYCVMAKRLLDSKKAVYTEINVDEQAGMREEMMQKTRRRTVPQIYIGDLHVGGFDDLNALNQAGKLDTLLAQN